MKLAADCDRGDTCSAPTLIKLPRLGEARLLRVARHILPARPSNPSVARSGTSVSDDATSGPQNLALAQGHTSLESMRRQFEDEGYLMFPRFLAEDHIARITADMDSIPERELLSAPAPGSLRRTSRPTVALLLPSGHRMMRGEGDQHHWWGTGSLGCVECSTDGLGGLTSHPAAVKLVAAIAFGNNDFGVHHIHAHVHYEGDAGVAWHQDYEQYPQTDRERMMCHCFYCTLCSFPS